MAAGCDLDVFQHGEIAEDPDVLEGSRQAEPRDAVRLEPENLRAVDSDRAGVRMRRAAQRVQQRGLAGAVGADDGLYDATRHVEIDAVERDQAAEAPRHATRADDWLIRHRAPSRRRGDMAIIEARPPGSST